MNNSHIPLQSHAVLKKSIHRNSLTKKKLLLACSMTALFSSNQALALDLPSAIQKTTQTYPTISAKKSESEASRQSLIGSVWQLGPNLSYSRGQNGFGQETSLTRVQQPLFTGGKILFSIQQAQANRQLTENEVISLEQELIVRVSESYIDVSKNQEKLDIARKNAEEHKRLQEMIFRRNQAGLSSDNDVTLANMRFQQSLSELEQYNSIYQTSLDTLSQWVGELINRQSPITPIAQIKISGLPQNLQELKELTLSFSPQINVQKSRSDVARAKAKVERSVLLPQVFLRHDRHSGPSSSFGAKEQTYVAVEYQFGSGLSSAYNWSAAVSQEKNAESLIEAAEKESILALTRDWNQFSLSKNQVSIIEKQSQASKEVMDSFLRQYTIGKRSWLEVLNAQREFSQTSYTLIDSRAVSIISQIKLAVASGQLKPDNLDLIERK
jgi:adhesin transport system outer membrane protein